MTASSFGGSPCLTDADCLPGLRCAQFSPYGPTIGQGICLQPCDSAGECPALGGLPHTCYTNLDPPLCYPGKIGLHCRSDSNCLVGLRCLSGPEQQPDDQVSEQPICTIECLTDQDCRDNRFGFANDTWCDAGVCVLPRYGGLLCQRPIECQSHACSPSTRTGEVGSGIMRCLDQQVGTL